MEYRLLGRTGVSVSPLCLGTMNFGTQEGAQTSEADGHRIMDRAHELGLNFFDTANMYGGGTTEEIIGRWFAQGNGRRARLNEIKGMVPSLFNLPRGCSFAPRCAKATDQCRETAPPLEEHRPGHLIACWHAT